MVHVTAGCVPQARRIVIGLFPRHAAAGPTDGGVWPCAQAFSNGSPTGPGAYADGMPDSADEPAQQGATEHPRAPAGTDASSRADSPTRAAARPGGTPARADATSRPEAPARTDAPTRADAPTRPDALPPFADGASWEDEIRAEQATFAERSVNGAAVGMVAAVTIGPMIGLFIGMRINDLAIGMVIGMPLGIALGLGAGWMIGSRRRRHQRDVDDAEER